MIKLPRQVLIDRDIRFEEYKWHFQSYGITPVPESLIQVDVLSQLDFFDRAHTAAFAYDFGRGGFHYNEAFVKLTGFSTGKRDSTHFERLLSQYYRSRYFFSFTYAYEIISRMSGQKRRDAFIRASFPITRAGGKELHIFQKTFLLYADHNGLPQMELSYMVDITAPRQRKTFHCAVVSGSTETEIDHECIFKNHSCFTRREIQVMKMIEAGMTSKQIADKLYVSKFTINNHRKNILKKSKAGSLSKAIEMMKELKLL